jgi:hypothetical protein
MRLATSNQEIGIRVVLRGFVVITNARIQKICSFVFVWILNQVENDKNISNSPSSTMRFPQLLTTNYQLPKTSKGGL